MRKHRWKRPPMSQRAAKQLWAACFHGEGWPTGWRVEWAGFMRNARGLCIYGRRTILLNYADAKRRDFLPTLVHEFIHVRAKGLRHGKEFHHLVIAACERAGISLSPELAYLRNQGKGGTLIP